MCGAISIGEWIRSVGPYPEKVQGWRALCVGANLPDVPGIPVMADNEHAIHELIASTRELSNLIRIR